MFVYIQYILGKSKFSEKKNPVLLLCALVIVDDAYVINVVSYNIWKTTWHMLHA